MRLLPILALAFLPALSEVAPPLLTLIGGSPVSVPGTDVMLVFSDVQDDRCPPGVICEWEGQYIVEIAVLSGGEDTPVITLSNTTDAGPPTATIGEHTFTLIRLTPDRDALAALGRAVQISDYTLELAISP